MTTKVIPFDPENIPCDCAVCEGLIFDDDENPEPVYCVKETIRLLMQDCAEAVAERDELKAALMDIDFYLDESSSGYCSVEETNVSPSNVAESVNSTISDLRKKVVMYRNHILDYDCSYGESGDTIHCPPDEPCVKCQMGQLTSLKETVNAMQEARFGDLKLDADIESLLSDLDED